MAALLLVLLVVLISVVGWRWNQLEVARSSRGRRMVKRMRSRSGRRRLHQRLELIPLLDAAARRALSCASEQCCGEGSVRTVE